MPFFENSSNFKITGGTFNVISGDLNQYETNHTTFTSHSFNNNPNGAASYHPYGSRPPSSPRGRARGGPPPRRPQYQHQEYGAYGYAEYYDDIGPGSDNGQYGEPRARGRFEPAMRSGAYVEIRGGEFNAPRNVPDPAQRGQDYMHNSEDSMSGIEPGTAIVEEIDERDSPSDTGVVDMSEEEPTLLPTTSDTAVPAVADLPPSTAQKPPTTVEKMRAAMAEMDITGVDQTQAADAAAPSLPSTASSSGKQKSAQSLPTFGKMFQRRTTNKS
ncbi:hypothetical protein DFH09DRAFT_1140464 [Mycena vulgaris]|nr:hypothetical protein DFH09DRAFT_1140464 [Mycena vulgaris]